LDKKRRALPTFKPNNPAKSRVLLFAEH
jgi:hypothetical protein